METDMANTSERPKKPMSRSQLAVILFVAILVMIGANLVLFLSTPSTQQQSDRAALFGVKEIVVEGNTLYDEEAILAHSGISVGQSIFSVNKEQAVDNIRKTFSYIEEVTVENRSAMDTIHITIKEAVPLGVMDMGDVWMLVSTTGRGLQSWAKSAEEPIRYLRIEGATSQDKTVGGQVLDDRSFHIVSTLVQILAEHDLQGITAIDMTDKTDIRVNWKNQITFLMGNDANLEHKVAVIAATLPKVMTDYGEETRGTLNVRDYSDDTVQKKYIVYRPEGLVTTKGSTYPDATATGTGVTGETTTTNTDMTGVTTG